MSRYDEIREAWLVSRDLQLANRDACFAFVGRFLRGLIGFLEIPPALLKLVPLDAGARGEEVTVPAASTLDADGFWRTGVGLSIGKDLPGAPSLQARLTLYVTKRNGDFWLKLYEDGELLRVPDAPDAELSVAFEFVYRELMRWLSPER